MDDEHVIAVGVAVLMVLAGCGDVAGPGASGAQGSTTPTPRTAGPVDVSGYRLADGVDDDRIWRRVLEMHGVRPGHAEGIDLRVESYARPSGVLFEATRFQLLWGFDPAKMAETEVAGQAFQKRVEVYRGVVDEPNQQRSTIAHEYAHVVQYRNERYAQLDGNLDADDNNRDRVMWMLFEGIPTYVENAYVRRYHGLERNATWREARANRSAFGRYLVAAYHFGERYVDRRVDDVEGVERIYEDPPRTTEQVLHGYAPGEEPPKHADVRVDAEASSWTEKDTRTKGELFVRLLLEGHLSVERARRAAAGWGGDELKVFWEIGGEPRGYAWALRWDDASEADEFAAAMRDYLDARGNRTDAGWTDAGWTDGDAAFRLVRTGEETVTLLAGDERFVGNASVAAGEEAGEVVVTVGEDDGQADVAAGTPRTRTAGNASAVSAPEPASGVDGRVGPTTQHRPLPARVAR